MALKNKIIVITGASSGLGAVLAEKVAEEGAHVVLVSRNEDELKKIQEKTKGHIFVCDISDLEQVKKTIDEIIQKFGIVDILVNNAGIWTDNEMEQTHPERREEALKTNALGTIQFTETLLPHLQKQKIAHIFNIISTSGDVETPAGDNRYWRTYGATKWAMSGYTKSLRDALQGTKIKVSGFFPGGFDSNLYEHAQKENAHNQPWMMQTSDIADIIVFCLTRPSDVLIEKLVVTKA